MLAPILIEARREHFDENAFAWWFSKLTCAGYAELSDLATADSRTLFTTKQGDSHDY